MPSASESIFLLRTGSKSYYFSFLPYNFLTFPVFFNKILFMSRIESTSTGKIMEIVTTRANGKVGGRSAMVTCPPEGPFEASKTELDLLASLSIDDFTERGNLKNHRMPTEKDVNAVKIIIQRLKGRYEENSGMWPSLKEMYIQAQQLGLLTDETLTTITRVMNEEKITDSKSRRQSQ